jgi:plastocyanin
LIQEKHRTIVTKAWFCLLAMSFLLLLAACGGDTNNTGSASTPTTVPTAAPTDTPTTAPTDTPTTASTSNGNSVTLASFAFSPASLTVKMGTKVTWTNKDSVTHTVTADQGAFDSGQLAPGQSFSFTFSKAGTYSYHCNIHPSMTATIVVQ